jgi:hypothetical protein
VLKKYSSTLGHLKKIKNGVTNTTLNYTKLSKILAIEYMQSGLNVKSQ